MRLHDRSGTARQEVGMPGADEQSRRRGPRVTNRAAALLLVATFATGCGTESTEHPTQPAARILRFGIGVQPRQTPERGLQVVISNFSMEGLVRIDSNGRAEPWLAQSIVTSPDGLQL